MPRPSSDLEETFAFQVKATGLPNPEREYRFHPPRMWRFDFAWPELAVAVECEGGTWNGGRHTTGSGFESDCKKYNQAAVDGWTVLRYPITAIKNGEAIAQVIGVLSVPA
jgi:hypothetical protein